MCEKMLLHVLFQDVLRMILVITIITLELLVLKVHMYLHRLRGVRRALPGPAPAAGVLWSALAAGGRARRSGSGTLKSDL